MEDQTPSPEPTPEPAEPATQPTPNPTPTPTVAEPLAKAWAVMKANRGVSIGLAVGLALLLLCCLCGVIVVASNLGKDPADPGANAPASTPTPTPSATTPSQAAPTKPSTSSSKAPSLFGLPVGTWITNKSATSAWDVAVTSATYSYERGCKYIDDAPPAGRRYLYITVEFSVTAGTADINPYDFSYVDSAGHTGKRSYSCTGDDDLDSGNGLPAGSKRVGSVIFEVPEGVAGAVEYEAGIKVTASWAIPA